MNYNIIITASIISFLFIIAMAFAVNIKASEYSIRGGLNLLVLVMSLAFWALLFIFECTVYEAEIKLFIIKIEYLGIISTPISFYFFGVINYQKRKISKLDIIVPFILGLFCYSCVIFNPWNSFYVTYETVYTSDGSSAFWCERGILFYVCQLMLLFGFIYTILLIVSALKKFKAPLGQYFYIVGGFTIPLIFNIMYTFGITLIDWTSTTFSITCVLYYIGFLNYGFIDGTSFAKRKILQLSSECIIILSQDNTISYINPAGEKLIKKSPEDVEGKTLEEILPGFESERLGSSEVRQRVYLNENDVLDLQFRIISLESDKRIFANKVIIIRNVTDENLIEEKLLYLKYHDEVTGLYNLSKLTDIMEKYKNEHEGGLAGTFLFACGISNLNILSCVLTKYQKQDLLLQVTKYIKEKLVIGTIIARADENEYIIFSNGVPINLQKFKDRINDLNKNDFKFGNQIYSLHFKMGIYIVEDNVDIENAFSNVLFALNSAYNNNNEIVKIYDKSIKLQHGLIKYVLGTSEEINYKTNFTTEYLPIINIKTNRLIGAEALARWNHPSFGKMYSNSFIGVFEQSGLINKLGAYIFNEAMDAHEEYQKIFGKDFYMCINISKYQIDDIKFIELIKQRIFEKKIDPSSLYFELKEIDAVDDLTKLINFSKNIINIGANISIDGFGWRSSSIAHIVMLKCKMVKLDITALHNIKINHDSAIIMDTFISLCNKMNLQMVVNRVEKITDLLAAGELGFKYVEGHIYSQSLNKNEFIKYCENFKMPRS